MENRGWKTEVEFRNEWRKGMIEGGKVKSVKHKKQKIEYRKIKKGEL